MIAKRLLPIGIFVFIFLGAFYFRSNTFWIPHWQGDQSQYVTLAMKLAEQGMRGYHLREVKIHVRAFPEAPDLELIHPELLPAGEKGDLYRIYEMAGFSYYNMPFFYKAPFFPATLALSHKIFTRGNHPFIVAKTNLFGEAARRRPREFLVSQAWAVIVPLGASLLTLAATFVLAWQMAGLRPALYAAFILAVNPISILTSNRLLTDDLAACLVTLSVLVFWYFYHRGGRLGVWFAGWLAGYAVLTNQKALLIFVPLWLYVFLTAEGDLKDPRAWPRLVLNPYFLLFAFGVYFVSSHWFWRIYEIYGNPFYQPGAAEKGIDETGWFKLLRGRPPALIFFTIGAPFLCPLFLAAYASLKRFVVQIRDRLAGKRPAAETAFLWTWVLSFVIYHQITGGGMEHRYLLMAYPALAILSGRGLEDLRQWINARVVQPYYGHAVLLVLMAATAFWTVPLALDAVFEERFLIVKPF